MPYPHTLLDALTKAHLANEEQQREAQKVVLTDAQQADVDATKHPMTRLGKYYTYQAEHQRHAATDH
jgi:hypothetical protein